MSKTKDTMGTTKVMGVTAKGAAVTALKGTHEPFVIPSTKLSQNEKDEVIHRVAQTVKIVGNTYLNMTGKQSMSVVNARSHSFI